MNDRAAFEDGYNVGKREGYSLGFRDAFAPIIEKLELLMLSPTYLVPANMVCLGRQMVEGDL